MPSLCDKLQAGSPLSALSATAWNRMLDMLRWWLQQGFSTGAGDCIRHDPDVCIFDCVNNTGSAQPWCGVLGIDSPAILPSAGSAQLDSFRHKPILNGVLPVTPTHVGKWVVLLDAAPSGGMAKCAAAGCVPVQVYVNATTDGYCEVSAAQTVSGTTVYLSTGPSGAEILWIDSSATAGGIFWAIVRLISGPPRLFARITGVGNIDSTGGTPPGAQLTQSTWNLCCYTWQQVVPDPNNPGQWTNGALASTTISGGTIGDPAIERGFNIFVPIGSIVELQTGAVNSALSVPAGTGTRPSVDHWFTCSDCCGGVAVQNWQKAPASALNGAIGSQLVMVQRLGSGGGSGTTPPNGWPINLVQGFGGSPVRHADANVVSGDFVQFAPLDSVLWEDTSRTGLVNLGGGAANPWAGTTVFPTYIATQNYIDGQIGDIVFRAVTTNLRTGWGRMDGSANSAENGGSGINWLDNAAAPLALVAGSSPGTVSNTGNTSSDTDSGAGQSVVQGTGAAVTVAAHTHQHNLTAAERFPPNIALIPVERLDNSYSS